MRLSRTGHLCIEGYEDLVHDLSRLGEAGLDAELHVDPVLLEIAGQRFETCQVVPVVSRIFETR